MTTPLVDLRAEYHSLKGESDAAIYRVPPPVNSTPFKMENPFVAV